MLPLKILHVGKFMPPSFGGMERALQSMASGMAARDHDVRVLVHAGPGSAPGVSHEAGVAIERVPYRIAVGTMPISLAYLDAYRRWSRWADIVHIHEPFPPASFAFNLFPKPARTVVSWHSDIVRQRLLRPAAELFQRRLCARANRIICSTGRMRDQSRVLAPWARKCSTIGFGLDPTPFDRALADCAGITAARRTAGGRFALAVGRLVSYKGFDVLLRALPATGARLVIIGEGPLEAELKLLSAQLGLTDRVVFAGGVSDAALPAYYAASEFLVMPSTTAAETFGIVQLEAMACAKPVINTALPTGVPEVSRDGVTGITVAPGDAAALGQAIARLWDDPALVLRFGRQARERVERRYSQEAVTERLERLYQSVAVGVADESRSSTPSPSPTKESATIV
jgi:rhamnosyl/mannosyltransferase